VIRVALVAFVLLSGCASHTAQIAQSASSVRGSVVAARQYLEAATDELDAIQAEAEAVSINVGHVSDDENPFVATLRYGSYIAVAVVAVSAFYFIKTRIP
jgi:hypothetical protein